MVRDWIVAGVSSSKLRDKLLNIGFGLTLENVIETARTYEISKQQTKVMSAEEPVSFVKSRPKVQKHIKHHKQKYVKGMVKCMARMTVKQ